MSDDVLKTNKDLQNQIESLQNDVQAVITKASGQFKELVRRAAFPAVLLDIQGKITYVNEHMLKVTGYKSDQLMDRSWHEALVPSIDKVTLYNDFRRMIFDSSGFAHYNGQLLTSSGESIKMTWHSVVIHDAQNKAVAVMSIAEYPFDYEVLKTNFTDSQTKFRSLIDTSGTPLMVMDKYGKVQDLNIHLAAMLGYENPKTIEGHQFKEFIAEQDAARYVDDLKNCMAGNAITNSDYQCKDANGNIVIVRCNAEKMDVKGIEVVQCLCKDVTDRKDIEEKAKLFEAEVESFKNRLERISRREKQVMALVASGMANKAIALELGISPSTVEKHRSSMMRKMELGSVAELVRCTTALDIF